MNNTDKVILVTGATGAQGGATARALLKAERKVRSLAFKSDTTQLEKAGSEIFRGNLDDPVIVSKAIQGAYGVFSVQNFDITNTDAERRHADNIVNGALKEGVEQIVHTSVSQEGNHENFPGWKEGRWANKYWTDKTYAVELVKRAGFKYWTILKPAYMMENFIQPRAKYVYPHLEKGEILTSLHPDTKLQLIAADDIGAFATAAFNNPEKYHGKTIDLASEALTMTEVAAKLSNVLGKKIKAVHVSPEEAVAKGLENDWVSMQQWQTEVGYNADIEALKQFPIRLTSFDEWAQKYKDQFLVE